MAIATVDCLRGALAWLVLSSPGLGRSLGVGQCQVPLCWWCCRHKTAEQKLAEWSAQARERELEKVAMKHIKEQAKAAQREEMMQVGGAGLMH